MDNKIYVVNYAYSEMDKSYSRLNPVKLIDIMFEKTDKDGTLIVPNHPYKTPASMRGKVWLDCKMEWTGEDRDAVKKEFKELYRAFLIISESNVELEPNPEKSEVLAPEERAVWKKYIRDIDNGHFERDIERSIDRKIVDHALAKSSSSKKARRNSRHRIDKDPVPEDEEIFLYWRYVQSLNADINRIFDGGEFAFDVCIRAKRLYYLMAMEAPGALVDNEARLLAKYMVLNKFCKKFNEKAVYSGYGLPIYKAKNVKAIREILTDWDLYYPIHEENSWDPNYSDWESVFYADGKYGEDIIQAYDDTNRVPLGVVAIGENLSRNREINPKGINLGGFEYTFVGPEGWPNIIQVYGDYKGDASDEDAIEVLNKVADLFGIDKKLVGYYDLLI